MMGAIRTGGSGSAPSASQITDAGTTGVELVQAETAAEARTALSVVAAPTRPPTTSVPLHWQCDETSGSTLASSGSASSASLSLGSNLLCGRRAGDAPFARGLACTSSGTVTSGAAGVTVGDGSALTLWAWVCVDSLASSQALVLREYGAHGTWSTPYCAALLQTTSTPGQLNAAINVSGTYHDVTVSDVLTAGALHLIGLTWDGTTLTVWVDGVARGTATPGAGSISWGSASDRRWVLGAAGNSTQRLVGVIYDAGATDVAWDASAWADAYSRVRGVA